MQNYLNFANVEGICFNVVGLERDPECLVCGVNQAIIYNVSVELTLHEFIDQLKEK